MSQVFDDIMQGLDEAIAYSKGEKVKAVVHDVTPCDVKAIREKIKMFQSEFADAVGVKLPTLRHWERGDRKPNGSACVLLNLLAKEPKKIVAMLQPT